MKYAVFIALGSAALSPFAGLAQQETKPLSFEVASIKLDRGAAGHIHVNHNGGLLTMTGVSVKYCIQLAYGIEENHVSGPSWIDSELYDITAKAPPDGKDMLKLQTLLADRFKLAFHRETREDAVYELVVAKGGPKMQRDEAGKSDHPGSSSNKEGHVNFKAVPMAQLASFLERPKAGLGRPVIDKTGIEGVYTFTLDWTPEIRRPRGPDAAPEAAREEWPPLMVALQQQLGLKLEARKGPVEYIVVDHAEKAPVEN